MDGVLNMDEVLKQIEHLRWSAACREKGIIEEDYVWRLGVDVVQMLLRSNPVYMLNTFDFDTGVRDLQLYGVRVETDYQYRNRIALYKEIKPV